MPPAGGPPNDARAERALLGALLLHGADRSDAPAEDFYQPSHRLVRAAITAVAARGEPVDTVTVAAELAASGHLDAAGGAGGLVALQASAPTADHADAYAGIVGRLAAARRAAEAAERLASALRGGGDHSALISSCAAELGRLASAGRRRGGAVAAADLAAEFLEGRRAALEGGTGAVETPWPRLDAITGGLAPGALVTVAARTGVGKTALACNIALHAAASCGVLFVSLEMGRGEIMRRLVSAAHRVARPNTELTGDQIRDMTGGALRFDLLEEAAGRIAKLDLRILDAAAPSAAQVEDAADGARVVIYDYLQLAPADSGDNRQEQVAGAARALKTLAMSNGATVVALSQVNRQAEAEPGRVPKLHQLRESGAIEQDSNQVWMLTPHEGRLKAHVAKNREGAVTDDRDEADDEAKPRLLDFDKRAGLLTMRGDRWGGWLRRSELAGEDW